MQPLVFKKKFKASAVLSELTDAECDMIAGGPGERIPILLTPQTGTLYDTPEGGRGIKTDD